MNKQAARHVIEAAFKSGKELQTLLGTLKKECTAQEYKVYARAVAGAIDGITVALVNRVLATHPELADEIEKNLNRSGHAM